MEITRGVEAVVSVGCSAHTALPAATTKNNDREQANRRTKFRHMGWIVASGNGRQRGNLISQVTKVIRNDENRLSTRSHKRRAKQTSGAETRVFVGLQRHGWKPCTSRLICEMSSQCLHESESVCSFFRVGEAADKTPAAAQLADGQHQFVASLLQRKVYSVVFRIHDAEETGVAEILRASAAKKNLAVQEDAHVVAVSDVEFFHLVAIRIDRGAGIENLHSRLRVETLGEVGCERDTRVRSLAVAIEDHETGWLRFDVLPLNGGELGGREWT